jgi:hypothetical protein
MNRNGGNRFPLNIARRRIGKTALLTWTADIVFSACFPEQKNDCSAPVSRVTEECFTVRQVKSKDTNPAPDGKRWRKKRIHRDCPFSQAVRIARSVMNGPCYFLNLQ